MVMIYLLYILSLVFIRIFAGYDSRFQKGKYITIRNNKLRMLLIDETSFFERKKRPKKDINRMSVSGLIHYIFCLAVLVLNVVLLCFVPKIPIEPWEIETTKFIVYADTLNEKISAIAVLLLFLSALGRLVLNLVRYGKTNQKWVNALIYIVSFVVFLSVIIVGFYMIKELVMSFI